MLHSLSEFTNLAVQTRGDLKQYFTAAYILTVNFRL